MGFNQIDGGIRLKDKTVVAIVGIGGITTIVVACIFNNIDGTIIASGCGIIGTIVGYVFGKVK